MIRVLILCLAVITAVCAPVSAAERFVSVIEDLPLMEGLVENENAAVTFETAGGRIAEAEARGNVGADSARMFYQSVLPQLGWKPLEGGVYERDGERLKLAIEGNGNAGAVVGFSLSPQIR